MYDIDKVKPAIILREPSDQLISWYLAHDKNKNPSIVDEKLLDLGIKRYEKFIKFWLKHLQNKNKDKDFLIINFKILNENSLELFRKILEFFSYEVNDEILKRSIQINTKENILLNIGDTKIRRIRFTNIEDKKIYKEKILDKVNKKIEKTEIIKTYNYFLSL